MLTPKSFLISDFSNVLVFPKFPDNPEYKGSVTTYHKKLVKKLGPKYHFFNHFRLNLELIQFYRQLAARNVEMYIYATNNIQKEPALQPYLSTVFSKSHMFSAVDLETKKDEPEGYKTLLEKINAPAKRTIFIDDQVKNLDAAAENDITPVQYFSNQLAYKDLQQAFLKLGKD